MIPKYKYNKAENKIVEVASMQPPNWADIKSSFDWLPAVRSYEEHISSLKSYPCHHSCIDIWEDGRLVSESDFCLKKCTDCKIGIPCLHDLEKWLSPCEIAFPTPPIVNEDEVLTEISDNFRQVAHDYKDGKFDYRTIFQWFQSLQQNYTITKK